MPVWRESDALLEFLREITKWPEILEVIVALAEETPESRIDDRGHRCSLSRGRATHRGRQMNLGARHASESGCCFNMPTPS